MLKSRILIVVVVSLLVLPVFAPTVRADITVNPTDDTWVDLNDLRRHTVLHDRPSRPDKSFSRWRLNSPRSQAST